MRVDFYLLNNTQPDYQWLVACRLLEKAYFKGHQVFVYCNNKEDAEKLDELLWTFRDDSFLPHNIQGEGPEPPPPIQIGYQNEPRGFHDILMNLSFEEIPVFHHKFNRIIEIVPDNENAKKKSRVNYKTYRTKGYELNTYNID